MEISKELIVKARACESEAELKALAEENNIEITDEEIKHFLADNAEDELAEEELDVVSGGRACKRNPYEVVYYKTEEEVQFIFNVGDTAQAFCNLNYGVHTASVRITERKTGKIADGYCDFYKVKKISGTFMKELIDNGWHARNRFEK